MTAPKMATNISAASLERSLQNCSLNQTATPDGCAGGSSPSGQPEEETLFSGTATVELNSHLPLPSHWQQFLDLKTGETYYKNLTTGVRTAEDPRMEAAEHSGLDSEASCWEEGSSYDSEEEEEEESDSASPATLKEDSREEEENNVLVAGGCKRCFMYFMVPKRAQNCPKCSGQLLRFDGSETGSEP